MITKISERYPALAHVLWASTNEIYQPNHCLRYIGEELCPFLTKKTIYPVFSYCTLVHADIDDFEKPKCNFSQWEERATEEVNDLWQEDQLMLEKIQELQTRK